MSGALRDLFAERIYNAIGGEQADRILGMFDWAVQVAAAREPVAPAEHWVPAPPPLSDHDQAVLRGTPGLTEAMMRPVAPAEAETQEDWPEHEPDCPMFEHPNDKTAPACTCRAALAQPPAPASAETAEMAWDALWRDIDLHYPKYKTLVSIKQKHRPAIEAAIRGTTPAPASTETEWDALIAECHTGAAARAAIYAHRDAIEAAIRGTTPLDAERLAEAIHNYGGVCAKRYGHINCTGPDHLHMAEKITAEYAALRGQPSEPEA